MAELPDIVIHLRLDTTEFDEQIRRIREELASLPVATVVLVPPMSKLDVEELVRTIRDALLRMKRRSGLGLE